MRQILTLLSHARFIRLQDAARRRRSRKSVPLRLHRTESFKELISRVASDGGGAALLDPYFCRQLPKAGPCGGSIKGRLLRLRQTIPHLPVGLYVSPDRLNGPLLIELARIGIDELVIAGQDDGTESLMIMLGRLLESRAIARFLTVVPSRAPPHLRRLIAQMVEEAEAAPTGDTLVAWSFMSRSSLWKQFVRAGMGPPTYWCRVARLYRVLLRVETLGCSFERSALYFGFPSGSGLPPVNWSR
jgi:hypothetical protein